MDPSALPYGHSAVGGIISMVTKRPQENLAGSVSVLLDTDDQKLTNFDITGALPAYRRLKDRDIDLDSLPDHLATLRSVGVPYIDTQIKQAIADARAQASGVDTDALLARYPKARLGARVAARTSTVGKHKP